MPFIGSSPAEVALTTGDLGDSVVNEAKMKISNSPTNGYMLTAQSGDTGGLTWAAAIGGKVVQSVWASSSAVATGSTAMPADDTIPQKTEGTEFETVAITPTASGSRLIITCNFYWSVNAGPINVGFALFQDSTANALAAQMNTPIGSTWPSNHVLVHEMAAGTTSSTTFKFRIGDTSGNTVTVNGHGGGRQYGGVATSSMHILEIST